MIRGFEDPMHKQRLELPKPQPPSVSQLTDQILHLRSLVFQRQGHNGHYELPLGEHRTQIAEQYRSEDLLTIRFD